MKANEAPEKIYIPTILRANAVSKEEGSIEYVRKDAFIEKACTYFRTLDDKEPPYETTEEFIKGFIKAMEQ